MKVEIIGFRKVDYTNNQNQQIKGYSIVAVFPSNDKYLIGSEVLLRDVSVSGKTYKKLPFVPDSVCSDISLGFYDVTFDINGSISGLSKVNK